MGLLGREARGWPWDRMPHLVAVRGQCPPKALWLSKDHDRGWSRGDFCLKSKRTACEGPDVLPWRLGSVTDLCSHKLWGSRDGRGVAAQLSQGEKVLEGSPGLVGAAAEGRRQSTRLGAEVPRPARER